MTEKTRKSVAKKTADNNGNTVTFTFADGTIRIVMVTDFPETIEERCDQQGMARRLGDK